MEEKEGVVLPMIGGSGETSYAANSRVQEKAILELKQVIEEAVKDVCTKTHAETFVAADLGCSSGTNTILLLSMIIQALADHYHSLAQKPPEVQCFLNDLPENDYNTLFENLKFLETTVQRKKEAITSVPNYYVVGAPGNFYGRLFPSNSVHFFSSFYSLHWRSKVPDGAKHEEGVTINKKNIHIAPTSTPNFIRSYYEQFKSDFSNFLASRFSELVPGGRMVLSILGRRSLDARFAETSYHFNFLADALDSLVQQGLVEACKVESFYVPIYMPSAEEVKEVIMKQRLFSIDQMYTMVSNWDATIVSSDEHKPVDNTESGKVIANIIRAVYEPLLARQFGLIIMDELFSRFAVHIANHLLKENLKFPVIVLSLVK